MVAETGKTERNTGWVKWQKDLLVWGTTGVVVLGLVVGWFVLRPASQQSGKTAGEVASESGAQSEQRSSSGWVPVGVDVSNENKNRLVSLTWNFGQAPYSSADPASPTSSGGFCYSRGPGVGMTTKLVGQGNNASLDLAASQSVATNVWWNNAAALWNESGSPPTTKLAPSLAGTNLFGGACRGQPTNYAAGPSSSDASPDDGWFINATDPGDSDIAGRSQFQSLLGMNHKSLLSGGSSFPGQQHDFSYDPTTLKLKVKSNAPNKGGVLLTNPAAWGPNTSGKSFRVTDYDTSAGAIDPIPIYRIHVDGPKWQINNSGWTQSCPDSLKLEPYLVEAMARGGKWTPLGTLWPNAQFGTDCSSTAGLTTVTFPPSEFFFRNKYNKQTCDWDPTEPTTTTTNTTAPTAPNPPANFSGCFTKIRIQHQFFGEKQKSPILDISKLQRPSAIDPNLLCVSPCPSGQGSPFNQMAFEYPGSSGFNTSPGPLNVANNGVHQTYLKMQFQDSGSNSEAPFDSNVYKYLYFEWGSPQSGGFNKIVTGLRPIPSSLKLLNPTAPADQTWFTGPMAVTQVQGQYQQGQSQTQTEDQVYFLSMAPLTSDGAQAQSIFPQVRLHPIPGQTASLSPVTHELLPSYSLDSSIQLKGFKDQSSISPPQTAGATAAQIQCVTVSGTNPPSGPTPGACASTDTSQRPAMYQYDATGPTTNAYNQPDNPQTNATPFIGLLFNTTAVTDSADLFNNVAAQLQTGAAVPTGGNLHRNLQRHVASSGSLIFNDLDDTELNLTVNTVSDQGTFMAGQWSRGQTTSGPQNQVTPPPNSSPIAPAAIATGVSNVQQMAVTGDGQTLYAITAASPNAEGSLSAYSVSSQQLIPTASLDPALQPFAHANSIISLNISTVTNSAEKLTNQDVYSVVTGTTSANIEVLAKTSGALKHIATATLANAVQAVMTSTGDLWAIDSGGTLHHFPASSFRTSAGGSWSEGSSVSYSGSISLTNISSIAAMNDGSLWAVATGSDLNNSSGSYAGDSAYSSLYMLTPSGSSLTVTNSLNSPQVSAFLAGGTAPTPSNLYQVSTSPSGVFMMSGGQAPIYPHGLSNPPITMTHQTVASKYAQALFASSFPSIVGGAQTTQITAIATDNKGVLYGFDNVNSQIVSMPVPDSQIGLRLPSCQFNGVSIPQTSTGTWVLGAQGGNGDSSNGLSGAIGGYGQYLATGEQLAGKNLFVATGCNTQRWNSLTVPFGGDQFVTSSAHTGGSAAAIVEGSEWPPLLSPPDLSHTLLTAGGAGGSSLPAADQSDACLNPGPPPTGTAVGSDGACDPPTVTNSMAGVSGWGLIADAVAGGRGGYGAFGAGLNGVESSGSGNPTQPSINGGTGGGGAQSVPNGTGSSLNFSPSGGKCGQQTTATPPAPDPKYCGGSVWNLKDLPPTNEGGANNGNGTDGIGILGGGSGGFIPNPTGGGFAQDHYTAVYPGPCDLGPGGKICQGYKAESRPTDPTNAANIYRDQGTKTSVCTGKSGWPCNTTWQASGDAQSGSAPGIGGNGSDQLACIGQNSKLYWVDKCTDNDTNWNFPPVGSGGGGGFGGGGGGAIYNRPATTISPGNPNRTPSAGGGGGSYSKSNHYPEVPCIVKEGHPPTLSFASQNPGLVYCQPGVTITWKP